MAQLKIESILNEREKLPRKQRILCDFILKNINDADVLTVKQLSSRSGVGEATIFRFLKDMEYPSYAEFRSELHRYAIEFTRSSYWQMKASLRKEDCIPVEHDLFRAISANIDLLGKTVTPKLSDNFDRAVDAILSAPEVGIFGLRSSKAVALYFYYLTAPFLSTVCQFSHDEHYVFEPINRMPEGSVLFVVTSWPNTQTTVAAAEFCHTRGHKIILLTNSLSCPIAAYADVLMITPEANDQYTIVPYIAVLEALAKEIGVRMLPGSIQQLNNMDSILSANGITNWNDPQK